MGVSSRSRGTNALRIRPCRTSYTDDRETPPFEEIMMYDMKHLTKLKKLGELAPEAFKGFVAFDEAAFKEGAIPLKYKELMAVAVALTTQCPYCIEIHARKAKKAGATEQELAEVTLIAAALRAGGAITHGTHTLE
jgi:AhpD family alkylhydroperoxidase